MNLNDTARSFLATYAAGGEPEGGWLYGKALRQAGLDFTPDSLVRLDALLAQLRDRVQPTRADLDSLPGRQFEALLVFYLVELARRLSKAHFVWLTGDAARAALPPGASLPDGPPTRLVVDAPAQARLFRPLDWLEGQLLPGGERASAGDYLGVLLGQLSQPVPAAWTTVMWAVGRLGSWHMMTAADGGGVWPTRILANDPDKLVHIERIALERVVAWGQQQLNGNPDGEPWQVFSYPGFAEHAGDRVDAVIVLAATYAEPTLRLAVAFPYRPATEGRPLAILPPSLVDATQGDVDGQLAAALERGIRSFAWDVGGSWAERFEAPGA